ncbi:hypothetical protein ABT024_06985 [Streptomyces sp. NPDC002812]|uniref:hypothetical protein n=1 Tax=Streptomyces sp. NPDC002812 TaxID=3154434 RepID=UPI00331A90DF
MRSRPSRWRLEVRAAIASPSLPLEAAMRYFGASAKRIGPLLAALALSFIGATSAKGVQSIGDCPDGAVCVYGSGLISAESTMIHIFEGEPPGGTWSVRPPNYEFSVVNERDEAIRVSVDEEGKLISINQYCVEPHSRYLGKSDESAKAITVLGTDACVPARPRIPLPWD